jgi:hypothetical protein
MRALFLGDEQARDLAVDIRSDDDRAGLRERLHPRGDVWCLAKNLARCVDEHGPRVEADARGQLRRAPACVAAVKLGERALDGERCAHRALNIIPCLSG